MKLDKQQEAQSAAGDSISSVNVPVNVKEYPPSEVFTEPLPAYKKTRATAIQIARIAAFTVIACTTILGLCIIASSWIEATASCSQLIHAEALLHQQQNEDVADRPSYQALVDPLQSDESAESKQESIAAPVSQQKEQNSAAQNAVPVQSQFDSQSTPIQIKLPLQLDFDEIAGSLMEKNQRSRMNCVVEKKRAEEVMDHQPKTVRLPFGVNITTDPRYEHVTGERMAIYCETGHDQRNLPMENMQQQQQQQTPVIVPMPMNLPMMMPNQQMPPQPQMPGPMNQIPLSMITRASQDENMPPQSQQQKEEGPITIITREEHVIPIFQQSLPEIRPISSNSIEGRSMPEKILYHPAGPEARMMAEGRMLHTLAVPENRPLPMAEGRSISHSGVPIPAVPSDIVRPPPPPPAFHKIPIHVPTILQQVENQQVNDNALDEETESYPRPHYVQPRSVRSVDAQLHPRTERVRRSYKCHCTP